MLTIPNWSSDLSVGNPVVDAQHKQLLEVCRRLVVLADDPATKKSALYELINDVAELMRAHFRSEEEILRQNNCPNLEAHIEEHEMLYQRLLEQLSVCMQNKEVSESDFDSLMTCWLSHHLLEADNTYDRPRLCFL